MDPAHELVPLEGVALLIGVDRFMSEARAITNLIGNGVAAIAVSKMERSFDPAAFDAASRARAGEPLPAAEPG
jgi:aerobic C4-dicarboxylate transport protein